MQTRGMESNSVRSSSLAAELTEQLDSPPAVHSIVAKLSREARVVLSLFGLTDSTAWPLLGMKHALLTLGVEPMAPLLELLELGFLALDAEADQHPIDDFARRIEQGPAASLDVRVHPSLPRSVRIMRPEGEMKRASGVIGQIRESDGLEPVLRMGAIWQRVGVEPLRQTQQGALYKRDSERLEEDPVLSAGVNDALESLPGMPSLWLSLARRVGLIVLGSSDEKLEAASPEFWAENALHLPQMIATSWLGLRDWCEWDRPQSEDSDIGLPLSFLRPTLLLWLATLGHEEWVALDDLAEHLEARNHDWDRLSFQKEPDLSSSTGRRGVGTGARGKAGSPISRATRSQRVLSSLLLGAGYAFGLVRAGEEKESGRKVVQLTSLGRYVLAMGPPPAPRPAFEHFLFVQPNLEIIAYRQGLTAPLVGWLSRFSWWTKIGAALELKLTQESVLFGLEGGITPARMLEILAQHSQHPLPSIVADAAQRWASRRERITFYSAATLIEFGTTEERDQALALWAQDDPKTLIAVADRFLLAENAQKIPTDKIRSSGSRDYRLPPDKCVLVEADGVTLALDPTRSDLLIDPELARIADELPAAQLARGVDSGPVARRYVVSAASLSRAIDLGITPAQIADWFIRRTGLAPSPAVKLLLRSTSSSPTIVKARRMLVLYSPSAELIDGLLQHPATRGLLGDRLGPNTLAMQDDQVELLQRVLKELGVELEFD
jgi:hypothetical protein